MDANLLHLDVSLKEVLGFIFTLIGAFWGLGKLLLAQTQKQGTEQFKQVSDQFATIRSHFQKQEDIDRRLEREVMELKASLPREYVRREDYIRGQSLLEAKLDGLATRIENLQLRAIGGQK